MSTDLIDGDYELVEGAAWLEVGPFAVRVFLQRGGLVVDVYNSAEVMSDPLGFVYVEMPDVSTGGAA